MMARPRNAQTACAENASRSRGQVDRFVGQKF